MNVAGAHLMLVHVPVVGCLGVVIVFVAALWLNSELLWKLGYGLLLASALFTVLAYFTGEPAYELLEAREIQVAQPDVTSHALVARAGLIGILLAGLIARQREGPARIGFESVAMLAVYAIAATVEVMG